MHKHHNVICLLSYMKYPSAVYTISLIVKFFMYPVSLCCLHNNSNCEVFYVSRQTEQTETAQWAWRMTFIWAQWLACCLYTNNRMHLNPRLKFKSGNKFSVVAREKDGILMVEAEKTEDFQRINSVSDYQSHTFLQNIWRWRLNISLHSNRVVNCPSLPQDTGPSVLRPENLGQTRVSRSPTSPTHRK